MRGEPLEVESPNGKLGSAEQAQMAAGKGVFRVDVDTVEQLYENYIIPLTKEVEVSPQPASSVCLTLGRLITSCKD